MAISYKISLGIDLGTSKVSVSYYSDTNKAWDLLLLAKARDKITPDRYEDYVEPCKIFLPLENPDSPAFGHAASEQYEANPNGVMLESIKRCAYCEWILQPTMRTVPKDKCENHKNFDNPNWCQGGQLQFSLSEYEWRPVTLLYHLLDYALNRAAARLDEQFRTHSITEVKLAFPMIFYRGGPAYESQLVTMLKGVAGSSLKGRLSDACSWEVVEEPFCSLMAHCREEVEKKVPNGHFMIVDIGAGTTDMVVCEKTGNRVMILDRTSIMVAGDNYDNALEALMRARLTDGPTYIDRTEVRRAKELFSASPIDLSVGYWKLSTGRQRERITLPAKDITAEFSKLDSRILDDFRKLRERVRELGQDLRGVYLTGGGSNIRTLRNSIEAAASEETHVPVWLMELADPIARKLFDARIVGVSMGAALPKKQYVKILKYALPVSLIVRYQEGGTQKDQVFYPTGQERLESGRFTLTGVDQGSPMRILAEKTKGERGVLISFPHKARSGRCFICWEITFNGWTKIYYEHVEKKSTKRHLVFQGYPHWKSLA